MSYNDFLDKLKKYTPYELIAADKICSLKFVSVSGICKNYKYDFMTSDNIKYEVKTDVMSLKTSNIFIEFMGYGKPSGIATTEANFYIINDTINYYLISVIKLKQLVKNTRILNTKDGLTSGFIISIKTLTENSKII